MAEIDAIDFFKRQRLLRSFLLLEEISKINQLYTKLRFDSKQLNGRLLDFQIDKADYYLDSFSKLGSWYDIGTMISNLTALKKLEESDFDGLEKSLSAAASKLTGLASQTGIDFLPVYTIDDIADFAEKNFDEYVGFERLGRHSQVTDMTKITIKDAPESLYAALIQRHLAKVMGEVYELRKRVYEELSHVFKKKVNWGEFSLSLREAFRLMENGDPRRSNGMVIYGEPQVGFPIHYWNIAEKTSKFLERSEEHSPDNFFVYDREKMPLFNYVPQLMDFRNSFDVPFPQEVPKGLVNFFSHYLLSPYLH